MVNVKTSSTAMDIRPLDRQKIEVFVVSDSALFFNSMNAKAKRDLLMPPPKKTSAEKARNLKHDPRAEFRNSIYSLRDGSETLLGFPAAGFKAAMAAAALVTEGVKKSDVQKLLYVEGELIPVYGNPYLRCDVVRSADINRTPDVRTRAFVPEWATKLTISYTAPALTQTGVINLLANAGAVCGIGDFRQEKGRGNFGRFRIVNADDGDWARIVQASNYAQQEAAMSKAEPWDSDTAELLEYFDAQVSDRELRVAA